MVTTRREKTKNAFNGGSKTKDLSAFSLDREQK